MSVFLTRAYQGFLASSTNPVTFPDVTEAALIAQGLATAGPASSVPSAYIGQTQLGGQGGAIANIPNTGIGTPAFLQGPAIITNIALGSAALTGYETAGVAPVSGQWNFSEILVPYINTWKGIGVLNGTTVGTNNHMVALWGSNGALLANSAVAGAVTAGASIMQNRDFLVPVTLAPGRYFIGVQANGVTDTLRHVLAANGSNIMCGSVAGVFGTPPATITVPTTFTTAIAVISQMYTT